MDEPLPSYCSEYISMRGLSSIDLTRSLNMVITM